ncbi:hypothetical protein DESC_880026 [Desulfosarcina cetonica]|nr:hypothetical protein DESC_880026 [Desulfosarcina cetonica]
MESVNRLKLKGAQGHPQGALDIRGRKVRMRIMGMRWCPSD